MVIIGLSPTKSFLPLSTLNGWNLVHLSLCVKKISNLRRIILGLSSIHSALSPTGSFPIAQLSTSCSKFITIELEIWDILIYVIFTLYAHDQIYSWPPKSFFAFLEIWELTAVIKLGWLVKKPSNIQHQLWILEDHFARFLLHTENHYFID